MPYDQELQDAVAVWLREDPDAETRSEIECMASKAESGDTSAEEELRGRLLSGRIVFGTAGLRDKVGAGYTRMNELVIIQTAQGLVDACEAHYGAEVAKKRGVVIGFDHRHKSRRFAEITANAFVHRGHRVQFLGQICPTPFVPYAMQMYGSAVGVMVTPSHNPRGYNGYKIYWGNAVQIIPPIDSEIAAGISRNLSVWDSMKNEPRKFEDSALFSEVYETVCDEYMKKVVSRCMWRSKSTNEATALKVVYTAMHGVGKVATERVLKEFSLPAFVPCVEQVDPDPEFSTVEFPNPEEKGALDLAMATADKESVPVVFAQDPDSDRFALAERITTEGSGAPSRWHTFTGNEIALLLADGAWSHHVKANPGCDRSKAVMLASTVSSKVLKAMSEHPEDGGFCFEETLTGFKWIGNKAKSCAEKGMDVILGYEVEIGFVVTDVSFDKDGVRTLAVFYEYADDLYSKGKTLYGRLQELYARYGFFSMTNSYVRAPTDEAMDKCFGALREGGKYAETIAGEKVAAVRDLTTGFDSSKPDKVAVLPHTPDAHMITYTLESGTTITLRNSGTEPKLKYYVETSDKESRANADKRLKEVTDDVMNSLIKPEVYGFK